MRTGYTTVAITAGLVLGLLSTPSHASAQDLFGVWTLNAELTQAPPSRTDRAEGQRPDGGQRRQGGRMGGGGGRPGGGRGAGGTDRQPDEDQRLRMAAVMRRLEDVPGRLTITHDGPVIAFASDDGRAWSARTDGEKVTRLTGDGEIVSKARMQGAELVVEEAVKDSPTLVYTYSLVDDGGPRRLRVTVTAEGRRDGPGRAARPIIRVYDAGS